MKYPILALALAALLNTAAHAAPTVSMQVIGRHHTGVFAQGAAEIVTYDAANQRLFKVNANASNVEVLSLADPTQPTLVATLNTAQFGGNANSVAVGRGLVAVAIEAANQQDPGVVAFYDAASLALIRTITVGALPDMVTFTPNGRYVLVANEGEPSDDYTVDPEGSVSIIDLAPGIANATVATADFRAFNGLAAQLRARGVRIFGPAASVAQDLEPEYITVASNSRQAWVSLQEANALALIDIRRGKVVDILPLGHKDHALAANSLDASDRDGRINMANWPVKGIYQPDAIANYRHQGEVFIVTANEGDSRDYRGFSEEARVRDLVLDPAVFPNAATLQRNENLGRLKVTRANGDTDGDGDYDELYSYGARSFSIRNARGELVFDSGNQFEALIRDLNPANFNSNHNADNSFDTRSDDKGPEPEGVVVGRVRGRVLAFIGLERMGGVMVYDVTDPRHPTFAHYINPRDFSVSVRLPDGGANPAAGDLGPEGMVFIPASQSPNRRPLLVVGNEVSGTTTVYQVNVR